MLSEARLHHEDEVATAIDRSDADGGNKQKVLKCVKKRIRGVTGAQSCVRLCRMHARRMQQLPRATVNEVVLKATDCLHLPRSV